MGPLFSPSGYRRAGWRLGAANTARAPDDQLRHGYCHREVEPGGLSSRIHGDLVVDGVEVITNEPISRSASQGQSADPLPPRRVLVECVCFRYNHFANISASTVTAA